MCGIIGYIGSEKVAPILLTGLRRLEYRGYDSAGMAVIGNSLDLKKDVGKIDDIHKKINFLELEGNIGIAHTRWATHGGVTKENAHPHLSNDKKIVVVHNGIVENYQELKSFLIENGFRFYSGTDSEVIPNLIEFEMNAGKSFEEATRTALKRIQGSYAILALYDNERKVIAARKGAPLVLGVGENGYFASSDIPSFIEHTKKVVYLHDYDVAVLGDQLKIYNILQEKEVTRPIDTVEWDIEQAMKGDFDHFMLKEISEQVDTIQRAVEQDKGIIFEIAQAIKDAKGVFFVACGTSYHACLTASYLFSKIAKMHINVVVASEFPSYEHFLTDKTLVIAVSQSGETADVLEAVKTAKNKNSKIMSLVNVVGSSLHRYSNRSLLMHAGPEICVVATKTYTSQLAVLTLLAYALADKYEEGKRELKYLWNLIYNLTSANIRDRIKNLAEQLRDSSHIFLIGRGLQYPTALEAALKIKEVSYIHAEGFSGGELKHGPITLIEKGTPCIVFVSEENEKETISNAIEIKSRGGYIIGIAPKNNEVFDFYIKVPEVGNTNPISQIIPIQILGYQLALLRGHDPDRPRNLAKSVTVK